MTRSKLLVSVRSVAEAEAALSGGADLIDVKEPSRGSLGAADDTVIRAVIRTVDGKVPVSAAMGEWTVWDGRALPEQLAYVKWGLDGLNPAFGVGWDPRILVNVHRKKGLQPATVLVAYADHERCRSPEPEWLARQAASHSFPAFLIDTGVKDGSTLLDWIAPATLARIRSQLADARVPVALAGSLDEAAIEKLLPLAPDWFAVRGAVCVGGREGMVCADRVRRLKAMIAAGSPR
jgi:(5-formylfuran-3-yl)methyl phosphate synthase